MEIHHAEPSLQLLRKMLRDPPADMGYEILPGLEQLSIPNFVNVRRAAQALQTAAMSDLHRSNLTGAKDNLVALAGFIKLYHDDPSLVNYMVRMAIFGLSTEVAWDALQADGWTDAQLAELQQAFQCADRGGTILFFAPTDHLQADRAAAWSGEARAGRGRVGGHGCGARLRISDKRLILNIN